ncbi:MAG: hypothetical protein DBX97_04170 [Collinsella tanakaei]|nr:MAG: hypothetical protein DBX97_04170 [Collinsella tanakaei]
MEKGKKNAVISILLQTVICCAIKMYGLPEFATYGMSEGFGTILLMTVTGMLLFALILFSWVFVLQYADGQHCGTKEVFSRTVKLWKISLLCLPAALLFSAACGLAAIALQSVAGDTLDVKAWIDFIAEGAAVFLLPIPVHFYIYNALRSYKSGGIFHMAAKRLRRAYRYVFIALLFSTLAQKGITLAATFVPPFMEQGMRLIAAALLGTAVTLYLLTKYSSILPAEDTFHR